MKVNIITSGQKVSGLTQDVMILRGILALVFEKDIEIQTVPAVYPHCPEADYNIFLEVINPSLFSYARKNIWIPNAEWTYKTWIPYLGMIDEIWAKTHEAYDIFDNLTSTPVKYIGWTSIDKYWNPEKDKKNYSKAIIPIGKNIYRYPQQILDAYAKIKEDDPSLYSKLPVLHIVCGVPNMNIVIHPGIEHKVILRQEVMKQDDYDELVKECGLCICISKAEGFCHAVNESISTGSHLILSPIRPFKDDLVGTIQTFVDYADEEKITLQEKCLGRLVDVTTESIIDCLKYYVETPFKEKRMASESCRELYEHRHKKWVEDMKVFLKESLPIPETTYVLKDVFPKEEDLPDVSIVTLTKDRRVFMPLAKYSYMIQSYPEDKLEWVIVDDGEDSIEDTLIGIPNVKYVRCEKSMTISEKRNLGVKNAMYDVIAMMDDDDVYPNNSILHRVAMLMKEPAKQCAFCTTIPCYDITRYSSFMNVPPTNLPMSERVSEATLIFTKKFWEERDFKNDVHVGEGHTFIQGREHMCRELSPQEVIVSLVHPKNTSGRKLPEFKEPNGCHWGFNENLFAVVSQIGNELNSGGKE